MYGFETRNKVRIILVDIFNKAMINEYVRRNPAKGIAIKRDEEVERRVLTQNLEGNREIAEKAV